MFEDADVAATAKALAGAITFNTGQVCRTATRRVTHDGICDEFVGAMQRALRDTKIGAGADRGTQMGPVVTAVFLRMGCRMGA